MTINNTGDENNKLVFIFTFRIFGVDSMADAFRLMIRILNYLITLRQPLYKLQQWSLTQR